MRWWQVDFETPQITVGKSKTESGTGRQIPMSADLRTDLERHAAFCVRQFGPIQPDWFVFPFSNTKKPVDPTRPVTSLKTAWESIKTDAGVTCRLHDPRHTFCTKLAEANTPEGSMLDMMGHVSAAMLRRYSHIRAQARRDAITAIEARAKSGGVPKESLQVADSTAKSGSSKSFVS